MTVRDEEIKAEKVIADQKKSLIKQILNLTPGYFVDDEFNLKDSNVKDQKMQIIHLSLNLKYINN